MPPASAYIGLRLPAEAVIAAKQIGGAAASAGPFAVVSGGGGRRSCAGARTLTHSTTPTIIATQSSSDSAFRRLSRRLYPAGILTGVRCRAGDTGGNSCGTAGRPCTTKVPGMASILIVDDDADGRDALCQFLKRSGYQVERVSDGRDTLAAVLAQTPDLIVLDMFMPQMDGGGLLEILRSYLRVQSLPVVILTGLPDTPWWNGRGS
jgi:hypothetical protein